MKRILSFGDRKKITIMPYKGSIYVHINDLVNSQRSITLTTTELELLHEKLLSKIFKIIRKQENEIETSKPHKKDASYLSSDDSEDEI
jgi:hypothetical protein